MTSKIPNKIYCKNETSLSLPHSFHFGLEREKIKISEKYHILKWVTNSVLFFILMWFLFSVTFLSSLFLLIIFEFQKMKFLSIIIASMTSGLLFEPINGILTNDAPNIDNPSRQTLLVQKSRSKRDLIGFNRQTNNNFLRGKHWHNRSGTVLLFQKTL